MAAKSLKKRIEDIVSSIPPSLPAIKGELLQCVGLVEALENRQTTAEQEARADLEAQLGDLKVALKTANTEIERLQKEQKEREKKDRDRPPIQFQILELLPSKEGGDWLKISEIALTLNIPADEAEVHIKMLKRDELVESRIQRPGALPVWYRSDDGNRLAIARRLAGDTEKRKTHKYADLPKIQHAALVMMAKGSEEGAIFEHQNAYEEEIAKAVGASLRLTRRNLRELRKLEMATDGDEPQQTYGAGTQWWLLDKGEEYLAERGLL